jgi:hypothetical protein
MARGAGKRVVILTAVLCALVVGGMVWGLKDRVRAEYWLYRLESCEGHMHTFDPSLKPVEFEKPGETYQKQGKCEHFAPCINLQACAEALRAIGVPAIPTLQRSLRHENLSLRLESVKILKSFGAPAIPAFCEALLNGYDQVRGDAARALGELGAAALPATSALLRALADESQWVRRSAENALEKIWSGKLIPNRCEVHQRNLLGGSIPPSYEATRELILIDDEATRELILRFPFANDSCNCGAGDKWVQVGDRRIPVRYCPECRAGKEAWRKGR